MHFFYLGFTFDYVPSPDSYKSVIFKVYDDNLIKDSFICEVSLPLDNYLNSTVHEVAQFIMFKGQPVATLNVMITYTAPDAPQLAQEQIQFFHKVFQSFNPEGAEMIQMGYLGRCFYSCFFSHS